MQGRGHRQVGSPAKTRPSGMDGTHHSRWHTIKGGQSSLFTQRAPLSKLWSRSAFADRGVRLGSPSAISLVAAVENFVGQSLQPLLTAAHCVHPWIGHLQVPWRLLSSG